MKKKLIEIIDEGLEHTDNVKKEYELAKIPTIQYSMVVGDYDKNKKRVESKTVTVKKIEIIRNAKGIIIGHKGFF